MISTRAIVLALTLSVSPMAVAIATAQTAATTPAPAAVETRTVGQLVMQNVPVTPEAVRERLIQYTNTRAASFQDFLPDGGILISTRFGDVPQIHEVKMPMGARSQLTYYAEPVAGAAVRPNLGGSFVFGKDKGGDEFTQAYLFDRATGLAKAFTEPGT